ncbi:unnamed protein product [Microthlaspi erraticum]|uniref:Uncharacterized protein n=1 Tax=Microthlaspi erraticum TaxID=1685480 RepID=A0A6D2I3X7_9BRAS|nr:unnamed protein product [Microthlaspi erraticum]
MMKRSQSKGGTSNGPNLGTGRGKESEMYLCASTLWEHTCSVYDELDGPILTQTWINRFYMTMRRNMMKRSQSKGGTSNGPNLGTGRGKESEMYLCASTLWELTCSVYDELDGPILTQTWINRFIHDYEGNMMKRSQSKGGTSNGPNLGTGRGKESEMYLCASTLWELTCSVYDELDGPILTQTWINRFYT